MFEDIPEPKLKGKDHETCSRIPLSCVHDMIPSNAMRDNVPANTRMRFFRPSKCGFASSFTLSRNMALLTSDACVLGLVLKILYLSTEDLSAMSLKRVDAEERFYTHENEVVRSSGDLLGRDTDVIHKVFMLDT